MYLKQEIWKRQTIRGRSQVITYDTGVHVENAWINLVSPDNINYSRNHRNSVTNVSEP
jgi:hypothetical protein